jgi:hypothetical protein
MSQQASAPHAQPERTMVRLVRLTVLTAKQAPIRLAQQHCAVSAVQGITPVMIEQLNAMLAPGGLILTYYKTLYAPSAHAVMYQIRRRACARLAPQVRSRMLRAAPFAPHAQLAHTPISLVSAHALAAQITPTRQHVVHSRVKPARPTLTSLQSVQRHV